MNQPKSSKHSAWIEVTGAKDTKNRYARLRVTGGQTLLYFGRIDDRPTELLEVILEAAPTATLDQLYDLLHADKRARW